MPWFESYYREKKSLYWFGRFKGAACRKIFFPTIIHRFNRKIIGPGDWLLDLASSAGWRGGLYRAPTRWFCHSAPWCGIQKILGQWFHIWAVFLLVPLFRTHGSYVSMFPTSGSQLGPASLCGVTLIHAVHYFWKNFRRTRNLYYICTAFKGTTSWSDARVVEEARLESVYTSKAYRGFESPLLRRSRCDTVAAAFLLGQFAVKPGNSRPGGRNKALNIVEI